MLTRDKMYDKSRSHSQHYEQDGQHIHRQAVFLKGAEKTRTNLQTYSEDKQYQSEILDK